MYATLRLLAHAQQSTVNRLKISSSSPNLRDELVFIQTKPLTRYQHRLSSGAPSAERKEDNVAGKNEKPIFSGPLPPPPRRQASLKISTNARTIAQALSSPDRVKADDKVVSTQPADPKRSGHNKSKSAGANPSLPPSTPLLNPFRTARPDGPNGFVSPPPVPPKPTKVSAPQKTEPIAPPLITIDHDEVSSNVESNPFRRRSMQGSTSSHERAAGQTVQLSKPPLPPRQPASRTQETASQAGFGNRSERLHPLSRQAHIINNVQPTSLLKPSRLIQEGLDAAERARSSARSPSPNNIITLSNYTAVTQRSSTLPPGFQAFSSVDSGSEKSSHRRLKKSSTSDTPRRRERSSTLMSITTNGSTSSDSSFTTMEHQHKSRRSDQELSLGPDHAESSPFADPSLIDTSLPPPPKGSVPGKSFNVIATSGENASNNFNYGQRNGSRRSTLKGNDAHPVVDQGLSMLKDLGDDVRRAAEGVGKDLEWIRGGRGGRTLGMTLANQEDQTGREGLMQNIERDHTGSTVISEDLPVKL